MSKQKFACCAISPKGPIKTKALPVTFESEIKDEDNCKFVVVDCTLFGANTSAIGFVLDKGGVVLGKSAKDEDYDGFTCILAFSNADDKKVKAKQLRELADWFDAQ